MAIEISDFIQAAGTIVGGNPATITNQSGWGTLTRAAAGDYSLVLDAPLSATDGLFWGNIIGAAASVAAFAQSITCIHTSDTAKRITTSVGGALADQTFDFVFAKISK